jgi:hypothetical protein
MTDNNQHMYKRPSKGFDSLGRMSTHTPHMVARFIRENTSVKLLAASRNLVLRRGRDVLRMSIN